MRIYRPRLSAVLLGGLAFIVWCAARLTSDVKTRGVFYFFVFVFSLSCAAALSVGLSSQKNVPKLISGVSRISFAILIFIAVWIGIMLLQSIVLSVFDSFRQIPPDWFGKYCYAAGILVSITLPVFFLFRDFYKGKRDLPSATAPSSETKHKHVDP
jgi:hypothetical protein